MAVDDLPNDFRLRHDLGDLEIDERVAEADSEGIANLLRLAGEAFRPPVRNGVDTSKCFAGRNVGVDADAVIETNETSEIFKACLPANIVSFC